MRSSPFGGVGGAIPPNCFSYASMVKGGEERNRMGELEVNIARVVHTSWAGTRALMSEVKQI